MKKFIHSAVLGGLFFISCHNLALGAPGAAPWSESESAPALTHVVDLKTGDELLVKNSAPSQVDGTRKQLRQRHPWRTTGLLMLGAGAVAGLCVGGYFLYPVIFGAGATYIAATIRPDLQCPRGMKEIGSGSTCSSGEIWKTHWGESWHSTENVAICSDGTWLNCAKSPDAQGCPSGTHRGAAYDGNFRAVFGRCEWEGSRQLLPDGSETVVCENSTWHQCEKDPSTPKPITTRTKPKPTTTRTKPKPITTRTTPKPITTRTKPKPITTRTTPKPITTRTTPKPITTRTTPKPITTRTPRPDLRCPRGMKKIGSGAACRFGETSATHNWGELWKGPAVAICPKDGVWRLCAAQKGAHGCPSGTHPGNTYNGNFRDVFGQCKSEDYSQLLPCQKGIVVCRNKSWTWCEKDPSTPEPMPEPEISTILPSVSDEPLGEGGCPPGQRRGALFPLEKSTCYPGQIKYTYDSFGKKIGWDCGDKVCGEDGKWYWCHKEGENLPPKSGVDCPKGMRDDGLWLCGGQGLLCDKPGDIVIQSCGRVISCGRDFLWHICKKGEVLLPQPQTPTTEHSLQHGQEFRVLLTCSEDVSRKGVVRVFSCASPSVQREFEAWQPYARKLEQIIIRGAGDLHAKIGSVQFSSHYGVSGDAVWDNSIHMPTDAEIRIAQGALPVTALHELAHPLKATRLFKSNVVSNRGYFCLKTRTQGDVCVYSHNDGHLDPVDRLNRRINVQPLCSCAMGPISEDVSPFAKLLFSQVGYEVRGLEEAMQAFEEELRWGRSGCEQTVTNITQPLVCGVGREN